MSSFNFRLFAVAAVVISIVAPMIAAAQDTASATGNGASLTKAQQKAQRKAARKEARAKKNAELKKLESAGYNPAARSDLNYPENLQNAEKKAADPGAASR